MKLTVKPHVLNHLLGKAGLAVALRSGDVILTTYKLEARGKQLFVSGTDLITGITTVTDAVQIDRDGSCCVPAKKFQRIIEAVDPDSDVVLELQEKGARLAISGGQASWTTSVYLTGEFPRIPGIIADQDIQTVNREQFLLALSRVSFAVSSDEARPSLQQVYFDGHHVYGCDSFRAQVAVYEGLAGLSIPSVALPDLIGLLKRSAERDIQVALQPKHAIFGVGLDTFSCTRLQAGYPNVAGTIVAPAQTNDLDVVVDRLQLIAAVKRVAISADAVQKAMTITLEHTGEPRLVLRAKDPAGEYAYERVPASFPLSEKDRLIGVNYQYLLDLLDVLDERFVTFKLKKDTPVLLSPLYVNANGIESVCMQFRTV